jgi:hypothetical protein
MRTFHWLKRLRQSERGNVLVIGAASLPLLMGATALAVDTIQLSLWKRQLQRAADSAAIAGAYALDQGSPIDSAVANDLDEHQTPDADDTISTGSFTEGTQAPETCAVRGGDPCYPQSVQVSLAAAPRLPFISFFTGAPSPIAARAVAALTADGRYCMISLYDGEDPGITAGGNGKVFLKCGAGTNSVSDTAIVADGSSEFKASPLGSVGNIGSGNNFLGNPVMRPFSSPIRDPLRHVPNPAPDPSTCTTAFSDSPGQVQEIPDGACYSSMDIKGVVQFNGDVFVYGGNVHINSTARITDDGSSTLVLTGPDGAAGMMQVNGTASITLTAPTSGPHAGVVLYRDRRAGVDTITLNGGADFNLTGAMYLPTTDLSISGNFEVKSECLQLVGRKLNFQGTTDIENECDDGGPDPFQITRVRIVS